MEPVYLDLHIHTSDDPNSLNIHYDIDTLISKIKDKTTGEFIVSFTDHNTINEKVYLDALKKIPKNVILGVELHIRSHKNQDTEAYHCHIYFNFDDGGITESVIKDINKKLDILYPNKQPARKEESIPDIQGIIETFDEYDFMLLPHGGQTHATFDEALPDGKEFDNAMQRSIYYNFFDGFTSRSDQRTEKTKKYLEKLGVHEFVNLITSTDNYNPKDYPAPRIKESLSFIPTWMLANPTFAGLRLSLSDSSRLIYSHAKPENWHQSIRRVKLKNDKIDIDVTLMPGLNVVIGESSSGKTLLVDSVVRKITGSGFDDSNYRNFTVGNIDIDYPDNLHPHYILQNYVNTVTSGERKINEIPIIARILPENTEARKEVDRSKKDLDDRLGSLFDTVNRIEALDEEISRIPVLAALISSGKVNENVLKGFLNTIADFKNEDYGASQEAADLEFLSGIEEKLKTNPFITHDKTLVPALAREIGEMREYEILENKIRKIVQESKRQIDLKFETTEGESQSRKNYFDSLIEKMREYYELLNKFDSHLRNFSSFSIEARSDTVEIEGYKLSIENKFKLNKEIVLDEFNKLLLKDNQIPKFTDIAPDKLYKNKFKGNQKGTSKNQNGLSYKTIRENINANIVVNDSIKYKIITSDGEDFDTLSPGRKTAIILHLILNFENDRAPLIIDQPEDNLATSYMNDGLVKSIKKMKHKKQIIFVSHNATIPMSGDAQNIILCRNENGLIKIRSNPLEGMIDKTSMVDYIAKIADGGKSSIKKRFKKYNLKKFKE